MLKSYQDKDNPTGWFDSIYTDAQEDHRAVFWAESFELVYECNTIQVLPGKYRIQARDSMVSLLAPQGYILVSCRSRLKGEQDDEIPLPLDKEEIDCFIRCGLDVQQ